MLPYIGAIVLISRADFSVAESALVVAGYCILMPSASCEAHCD